MGMKYRDILRERGSVVRGSGRAVLNVLADRANNDGQCKLSYPRLADETGLSERTVNRVVKQLVEAGELEITAPGNGRSRVTEFHLLIAERVTTCQSLDEKRVTERQPLAGERVTDCPKKGDNLSQKGDNLSSDTIYKTFINQEDLTASSSPDEPAPALPPVPDEPEDDSTDRFNAVYGAPPPEVDFGMNGRAPKSELSPKSEAQAVTEQQAMFGALCEATGADPKTLTQKKRAQIAQTAKKLCKAGYVAADVGTFMVTIWFKDWRWRKYGELPRLDQVQDEIGKIRAAVPVNLPASGQEDRTNQMIDNVAAQFRAQMEATGQHYGQP